MVPGARAKACRVVHRVQVVPDHEDAERHADVADRVHDEGLLGRRHGGRALPPEADQQVRREADEPPAGEQEHEVPGEHEQQHREHEQVEVREEALLLGIALHVADRVGVDQEADAGDHEQHHGRERVDEDAHVDQEAAAPTASASPSRRCARWESSRESRSMKASSESTKPARIESDAAQATTRRETLGPTAMLKPRPSERREQHEPAVVGGVHPCRLRSSSTSSGNAAPRQRHDQAEPDHDLGGRDAHDREREHVAVVAADVARAGDEQEVARVEHDLDREQDHDRVAAQHHADQPDGRRAPRRA